MRLLVLMGLLILIKGIYAQNKESITHSDTIEVTEDMTVKKTTFVKGYSERKRVKVSYTKKVTSIVYPDHPMFNSLLEQYKTLSDSGKKPHQKRYIYILDTLNAMQERAVKLKQEQSGKNKEQ